jgi:hypothetical protein
MPCQSGLTKVLTIENNSDSANGILQRYKIGHVKGAWLQRGLKDVADRKRNACKNDVIDWSKPIIFQVPHNRMHNSNTNAFLE